MASSRKKSKSDQQTLFNFFTTTPQQNVTKILKDIISNVTDIVDKRSWFSSGFQSLLNSQQKKNTNFTIKSQEYSFDFSMAAEWFIVVAALWGATNPFIKRGSKGIEQIKAKTRFSQFVTELKFLFFNWKYLVPFVLNQAGSVVYYITLGSSDISVAVPITNSLTFVFTILSGRLLGEKINHWETYIGMVLVLTGVMLCVSDKV